MRYEKLDILRGIAITLMIIFHINYSLTNIFWINFLNFSDILWIIIWKISVFLFIIVSWISFLLAEKKYKNNIYKKYLKYSFYLWILSFFITFLTYLFINSQIILFGIIHFFFVSYLLMLAFHRFKYYNIIIWIIIILLPIFISMETSSHYLFFLWFLYPWFYSADFYPIFPYFWVFLLSYSISFFLYEKSLLTKIFWWEYIWILNNFLKYIWKRSLFIYLIHQPIIIWVIYLLIK